MKPDWMFLILEMEANHEKCINELETNQLFIKKTLVQMK